LVRKIEETRGNHRECTESASAVEQTAEQLTPSLKVEQMGRKEAILKLRQVLLNRRDALRRALAGDIDSLNELRSQTSGDMLDAALDSAQGEISSQLAEVESRELAQIENALERMRSGAYGICEMTGKPIPLARLQALPYATMCIEAQREMEKKGGNVGQQANWGRLMDSDGTTADLAIGDIEMDVS
jgi:DnaK suppressor protein